MFDGIVEHEVDEQYTWYFFSILMCHIYIFITGKVVPPLKWRIKINVYNSYTGAGRDSECHFGSGDAQTQSTNDEAEYIDEEERDDPPDWEKKWK